MKLNRVKVMLAEKDKTNRWLAEQLDKSEVTISRWCSQTVQPSLKDLYRIAELLEMEVRELIEPTKNNLLSVNSDMKVYKANEELADILILKGFDEITSERDKKKGKRLFGYPGRQRKEVYFDYINIVVRTRRAVQDSHTNIGECELKYLLFYVQLKNSEFKEIRADGRFRFEDCEKNIIDLKKKIDFLSEFNKRPVQLSKLEKLLKVYESIELD